MIFCFSESFKKYLSNDTIKFIFGRWLKFANFGQIPWIIYSPWSKGEKWQIMVRIELGIRTRHLKGLFLSFQKIRKSMKLDHQNKSYGCSKLVIQRAQRAYLCFYMQSSPLMPNCRNHHNPWILWIPIWLIDFKSMVYTVEWITYFFPRRVVVPELNSSIVDCHKIAGSHLAPMI